MHFSFCYLYCAFVIHSVNSQDAGKVFIGAENDTRESYDFSRNVVQYNQASLFIPVYVNTGSSSNVTHVNVTCGLTTGNLAGYSYAAFSYVYIAILDPLGVNATLNRGQIPFAASSTVVGRSTSVQCWGVALPDFTASQSISDPKGFSITPAGKVHVFYTVNVIGAPFWIKLSEPAVTNDVSVQCNTTVPNSSYGTATVLVGYQIQLLLVTGTVVNSTSVQCTGQSSNRGLQFMSNTSAGEIGLITPFVGAAALYPAVTHMTSGLQMKAFLVLNTAESETSIDFSCSIYTLSSLSAAANFTAPVSCPTSSVTTPSPANETSGIWTLSGASCAVYSVPPKQPFALLTLVRTAAVSTYTEESVYVQCRTANPLFSSLKPNLAVTAYLFPPTPINWTLAAAYANQTKSQIPNPGYVNVAPCPCSLMPDTCDTNCCCDPDCTADDLKTFRCFPGFFGGYQNATTLEDFCNTTYFYQPDWFPMMCIVDVNTGFLGYFYYPVDFLQSLSAYNAMFSYYELQPIGPGEPNGSTTGYKQGLAVKTGLQHPPKSSIPKADVVNFNGPNYLLSLPQRAASGRCSWLAPVQFLVDLDDVCDVALTQSLCSVDSQLSALMYAQSSDWGTASGPLVLEQQNVRTIASTNVNFLCAGNVATPPYVKSKDSYAGAVPPNTAACFPTNSTCTVGDCAFNDTTSAYVCPADTVYWDTVQSEVPRCFWDNGFARPPAPTVNGTTGRCDNVVLSAVYNFTWTGQTIALLNATVVLGNVALGNSTTGPVNITQTFSVVFVGNTTETTTNTTTATTNSTASDLVYPFSGNPGYNKLLPVISGVSVLAENSTDTFTFINANATNRLTLFNPDSTGLCTSAGRKDLLFTLNELTSCQLRLNYNNFLDCNNLRKMTLNALDSLMPSNYVSIIGNPSISNTSQWLAILRQDMSYLFPNITNNFADGNTSTSDLPLTTLTAAVTTATLSNNSFVTVAPMPSGNYSYLEDLAGVCRNVPSDINVDILYAEVGQSNYHPIYMIVGARINYTVSNWTLYCVGAGAASCSYNSSAVQSFLVSSSVRFVQVPATTQPPQTRHEQQTYVPPYVCPNGVCWSEFFYPFMAVNLGMNQQLSLMIALVFSVFIIVLATLLVLCGD